MADYDFFVFYRHKTTGAGVTGLTPAFYGVNTAGTVVVNNQPGTELAFGLYWYRYTSASNVTVIGKFVTASTDVEAIELPALAVHQVSAYLDAAITTRSSHSAADVWTSATRTLTSFGTLAADVWASATRTLTDFGTLVSQIIAGLSGAAISLVAPVLSSERVEIVAGDDYKNADGRALNWTLSGFPVFTGGSVLLSAGPLQAAGSVVSATQLRVELTAAQSALLTPGTRVEFKLKVTLSGGNKITAARGYIEVA